MYFFMTFIPMHAQQLVIIQWMDSCIPKEEEDAQNVVSLYLCNQCPSPLKLRVQIVFVSVMAMLLDIT